MRTLAATLRGSSLLVSLMTRRLYKIIKVALLQLRWLYTLAGVSGGKSRVRLTAGVSGQRTQARTLFQTWNRVPHPTELVPLTPTPTP